MNNQFHLHLDAMLETFNVVQGNANRQKKVSGAPTRRKAKM